MCMQYSHQGISTSSMKLVMASLSPTQTIPVLIKPITNSISSMQTKTTQLQSNLVLSAKPNLSTHDAATMVSMFPSQTSPLLAL